MKSSNKRKIGAWAMVLIGGIYLLNFTFGVIELLPDNLPIVGNLDEGGAGVLVFQGIKMLMGKK